MIPAQAADRPGLPAETLEEIAQVLAFDASRIAEDHWRQAEDWRWRRYATAMNHLVAWMKGEDRNPESGLPRLAHAICCLVSLRELDRCLEKVDR